MKVSSSRAQLELRHQHTQRRLASFTAQLEHELGGYAARTVGDHTCVYATGSGGRGEMGEASDLDLFLVRIDGRPSRLDAVLLQSAVVRSMQTCQFEEPSGDGHFLDLHTADDLSSMFGGPQDDATNKFTARMLLLLESKPLIGELSYAHLIDRVLERYWQNVKEHDSEYLPIVFVNDVIRWWRVVLLNHEWKLAEKEHELGKDSARLPAERRLRSFKLRFARCLTCFASLAHLLATTRAKSRVSLEDMKAMIAMTPFDRLHAIRGMAAPARAEAAIDRLQDLYVDFLRLNDLGKLALRERFADREFAKQQSDAAQEFSSSMFTLIDALGQDNPLYRFMIV